MISVALTATSTGQLLPARAEVRGRGGADLSKLAVAPISIVYASLSRERPRPQRGDSICAWLWLAGPINRYLRQLIPGADCSAPPGRRLRLWTAGTRGVFPALGYCRHRSKVCLRITLPAGRLQWDHAVHGMVKSSEANISRDRDSFRSLARAGALAALWHF